MKLNLDKRFSPEHVLDIFPEDDIDQQILKDFLGFIGNNQETVTINAHPIEGGICVWVD